MIRSAISAAKGLKNILRHGQNLSMPLVIMQARNLIMSHDRRPRSEATWYNGSRKGRSVDNCTLMGGAFDGCFTEDSRFCISVVRGLLVSLGCRALRRKPVPRMSHDRDSPVVLPFAGLWQALAAARRRRGKAREAYEVKDSFREKSSARRGNRLGWHIEEWRRQSDGTIGNQGKGRDGDRLCEGH